MKKKKIAIAKISALKNRDLAKNILASKDQSKIKGGASPWLEGPG